MQLPMTTAGKSPSMTDILLDDLKDPAQRKTALRLMMEVIRADGRLAKEESLLFWQAIERWGMQISDVVLSIPGKIRKAGKNLRSRRNEGLRAIPTTA